MEDLLRRLWRALSCPDVQSWVLGLAFAVSLAVLLLQYLVNNPGNDFLFIP